MRLACPAECAALSGANFVSCPSLGHVITIEKTHPRAGSLTLHMYRVVDRASTAARLPFPGTKLRMLEVFGDRVLLQCNGEAAAMLCGLRSLVAQAPFGAATTPLPHFERPELLLYNSTSQVLIAVSRLGLRLWSCSGDDLGG